jgi:hypothetical protein
VSSVWDHPRGLPEPGPQELRQLKQQREHNAAMSRTTHLAFKSDPAEFASLVKAGARFTCGKMTGHPVEGWPARGVPHPAPMTFTGGLRASLGSARYVVMGGDVPIAWLTHQGWVIPALEPSTKSTDRQQDLMRRVAALWSNP